jgi:hypothetical protein
LYWPAKYILNSFEITLQAYWRPDTDHIVENDFNLTNPESK